MMIFAEAVTFAQTGTGIGVVFLLMGALLLFLNLKEKLFPRSEEKRQVEVQSPLSIRLEERFATKDELREVKTELRELEKALPETELRIRESIEKTGDKILAKVGEIGTAGANGRRDLHEKARVLGERISVTEKGLQSLEDDLRS